MSMPSIRYFPMEPSVKTLGGTGVGNVLKSRRRELTPNTFHKSVSSKNLEAERHKDYVCATLGNFKGS